MYGCPHPNRGLFAIVALVIAVACVAGCGGQSASPRRPRPTRPPVPLRRRARRVSPKRNRLPARSRVTTAPTVLLAAGDIGRCDSTHDDATGAMVAGMPGVVATLGDTAYEDGTTAELNDCFGGSWGAVKDRIRFAVTGNHDVHTRRWRAPAGVHGQRGRPGMDSTWFSDDLGAWHVIVLDGNCGLSGSRAAAAQTRRRGSGTTSRRTAPRARSRCSTSRGSAAASTGTMRGFATAVGRAVRRGRRPRARRPRSRLRALRPAGSGRHGGRSARHRGDRRRHRRRRARGRSRVRVRTRWSGSTTSYGVLELTLLADSWSSRFVGVDGSAHDQAAGPCH